MMKRRTFLATAAAAAASAAAGFGAMPLRAQAKWPTRPVTLICPWGAGGGTDQVARIIGTLMEKDLGQPINVVNRTGGNGVVGHAAISQAQPDGYTIGIITVEIVMLHWQGLTQIKDTSYTPLALLNADPPGIQVKADSPYKTAEDLIDFIRANPGKLKASGTGQGGIWHVALAGWLRSMDVKPDAVPWVPSNGAAPAMQDLAAGGVDIVTCSVPEARSMIDAGKARSLAVMSPERNPAFPNVPTLRQALNSDWTIAAWRGIAAPKGVPKEVVDRLVPALQKAWEAKEFKDFMAQRGFGTIWGTPDAFAKHMAEEDAKMGVVMKALGLAKG